MTRHPSYLKESPSQTAGPYVHIGTNPNWVEIAGVWDGDLGLVLIGDKAKGERVVLTGRVIDGAGNPVRDALVEIWQADADGLHHSRLEKRGQADPEFSGWGRMPVDGETGVYRFETVKPGRVPWPDGRLQAPHVTFWIVARGINTGLHTRLYFGDEEAANAQDPLLNRIDAQARRETLVARRNPGDVPEYVFDVRLQGDGETVFLDM